MANTATINSLVTSTRRRLNLVNMTNISDVELQEMARDSLAQLHEILVSRWRDYYVKSQTYTLLQGVEAYDLPADFRAASGVFLTDRTNVASTGVRRLQLRVFNLNEWNNLSADRYFNNQWPVMYRIMGNKIYFTPTSSNTLTDALELWYVPAFAAPATNTETIGVGLPNGWELWVIFDMCVSVAARMRMTEFYQMYSAERERSEARVVAAAAIRDETAHTMVNQFDGDDGSFWRGGGF